ncbi:unnamed protein product [Lymnaea stagnalis]|uniref:Lebercilin domain-containing protein n=1 Tax=Lymnaea stagnalis TaxID=6523 RepID=A0AAV2GYC1_LYMST
MGSGSSNQILDSSTGDKKSRKKSESETRLTSQSTRVLPNIAKNGLIIESKSDCDSDIENNASLMHIEKDTTLGNPRELMKIEANLTSPYSSYQQVDVSISQLICELQNKIKQRDQEVAKVESEKLDLQDQLQTLEERLKDHESVKLPFIDETPLLKDEKILAKDQHISKLESDLQRTVEESNKIQLRLKKKIRMLRNQVRELRQEASIKNMEMKLEMNNKYDQGKESSDILDHNCRSDSTLNSASHDNSHSKVIVELSNQLTEQSEQIAFLESKLAEKDLIIKKLENSVRKKPSNSDDNSTEAKITTTVLSKAVKTHSTNIYSQNVEEYKPLSNTNKHSNYEPRPVYERQSTALSDSDSDWGLDNVIGKDLCFLSENRVQSALTVSHNGKEELQPKPASAGSLSDHNKKHRKQTALQRRVNDKLKPPHTAFTGSTEEHKSESQFDADMQHFKDSSHLPELSKVK